MPFVPLPCTITSFQKLVYGWSSQLFWAQLGKASILLTAAEWRLADIVYGFRFFAFENP